MTAMPMINLANLRRLQYGMISSGERSSVRFKPSGVISYAQEINSATAKPSPSNTTNAVMIQSGASSIGKKNDALWISSHATTAYVSATLNTLRLLNSANNEAFSLMALRVDRVWRA